MALSQVSQIEPVEVGRFFYERDRHATPCWTVAWACGPSMTGDANLVAFTEAKARALFARAYLDDCGCWAGGMLRGGALDVNKSWFVYVELDQLVATLAAGDPTFAQPLRRTYDYWFTHFVDKVYGEVWNTVDGRTHAPMRELPKQWPWKTAYHSFEHALVGYIVAQQPRCSNTMFRGLFPCQMT